MFLWWMFLTCTNLVTQKHLPLKRKGKSFRLPLSRGPACILFSKQLSHFSDHYIFIVGKDFYDISVVKSTY